MEVGLDKKSFQSYVNRPLANRYIVNKFEHAWGCCKLTSLERSLDWARGFNWTILNRFVCGGGTGVRAKDVPHEHIQTDLGDLGQGVLMWVGGGAGSGAIGVLKWKHLNRFICGHHIESSMWNDRHNSKHYLSATSLAGGENVNQSSWI